MSGGGRVCCFKCPRIGGEKKREASRSRRLLVCTLSHKEEPLSGALSRAFQGTKANDTVPGMACVCSGSLMVFLRRSYACKRPGLFPSATTIPRRRGWHSFL